MGFQRTTVLSFREIFFPAAACLFLAANAAAGPIEVEFLRPTDNSTCVPRGDSEDRSCTKNYRVVSNGGDARSSTIEIYGQASADRSQCWFGNCPPTPSASLDLNFRLPLAIYRAVEVVSQGDGSYTIVVPQPTIELSFESKGWLATDGAATNAPHTNLYDSRVYILSDEFMGGLDGLSFAVDPTRGTVDRLLGVTFWSRHGEGANSYEIGEGSSVGEIGAEWNQNLFDFNIWEDDYAPYFDYDRFLFGGFWQEYLGYINFRTDLYAKSANGDEQIACYGLTSPLSSFRSDAGCSNGYFRLTAKVRNYLPPHTFTVIPASQAVSEPGTLALLGLGLAGMAARHKKKV